MRHSIEVMQGMSAASAMSIVSAIANGHTGWMDILRTTGLESGRMSLIIKLLKRKGVLVQHEAGGPYQLTPDAVKFYGTALIVEAEYEAKLEEACDVQP